MGIVRNVFILLLLLSSVLVFADNETDDAQRQRQSAQSIETDEDDTRKRGRIKRTDYTPEIHATIRAKYEYSPQVDAGRFQLRNARLQVRGKLHPIVGYKAEVDLSDAGKMKLRDIYINVAPIRGLSLYLGHLKVDFSTDNLRSPHTQYFANNAFGVKYMLGQRDVGLKVWYDAGEYFPLEIVAGVYNGTGSDRLSGWRKSMDYSARMIFTPLDCFAFDLNWQTIKPEFVRIHMFDLGMQADFYNVHLETEALYHIYRGNKFKPAYAFNFMAAYDLQLPKVFDKLRFLARYDMMSDYNSGIASYLPEDEHKLNPIYEVENPARQRVTVGVMLALSKPILAELRVNYEKCFYQNRSVAEATEQDKLVVELMVRF